jgi:hypothetical protein
LKKSFFSGLLLLVISFVTSLLLNDWELIYKISGTIGIASLLFSGLFLGAYVGGEQLRANYNTEDKIDHAKRTKYAYILISFSLPNLIGGILAFILI